MVVVGNVIMILVDNGCCWHGNEGAQQEPPGQIRAGGR